MNPIGELKGQHMLARGQRYIGAGLSLAKMEMGRILWYYLAGRNTVTSIDQQMVMTGTGNNGAGRIEL